MKKYIILALIFTALTSVSFGQGMQLGLKAGVNFANEGGSDVEDFFDQSLDSRTGFNAGIFFMYQFNKMFAIQPEAYYTMKGATADFEGVDFTLKLDYIEVPLLFKLIIPVQGSNITPSIFAGPAVGFKTTAKIKGEYEGQSAEQDIDSLVTSTDFSLIFGGGLGFMVGANEVGFDVRYSLGLSSWDNYSDDPADVKNNVLSINAYFGFNLH